MLKNNSDFAKNWFKNLLKLKKTIISNYLLFKWPGIILKMIYQYGSNK